MDRPLRIAQIAPIARAVTPDATGSIEQIVSLLTDGLVERGHEVTLFATGYSRTSARLEALHERGYEHDPELWEWEFHELMHVAHALERADEFDVVHSHVYHFGLPFTRLVRTPIVNSYHVLPEDDVVRLLQRYPDAHVISVSAYQRKMLGLDSSRPVVHHGVDLGRFRVEPGSGEYLLFLGQLSRSKGVHDAVALARRAELPLVVAGAPAEGALDDELSAVLGGRGVTFVGWADVEKRAQLFSRAMALVYPISTGETFGLVMVEAMASGVPVLATDIGAVPEIVEEGITGYRARDIVGLAARVPAALALDRHGVRARAEERFGHRRMVAEYERIYRELAGPRLRSRAARPIPSVVA